MTALQVILLQLLCPRDQRANSVQFQLTCNLCLDSHKTQKKSDAMLYSPSVEEATEHCKQRILSCYVLELLMIFEEERIEDNTTYLCFKHFNDRLNRKGSQGSQDDCSACETHSLENSRTFLENFKTILQKFLAMDAS